MKYKVLIAENQSMPRELLEIIVKNSQSFTLAGSVKSAAEAVGFCKKEVPDLILLEIFTGPGINGLDAAEFIKERHKGCKIIILTETPDVICLNRAKKIPVDSYLYKNIGSENILAAMEKTMAGEHIFPKDIPIVQVGKITNKDFTTREYEVLRELPTGDSNNEIAEKLGITTETVKFHLKSMLKKTGFHSRTELATEALVLGIISKF